MDAEGRQVTETVDAGAEDISPPFHYCAPVSIPCRGRADRRRQPGQNGEEPAQPVLSVKSGGEIDPDDPHVRGVIAALLSFRAVLGFFQVDLSSRRLLRSTLKANAGSSAANAVCEIGLGGGKPSVVPWKGLRAFSPSHVRGRRRASKAHRTVVGEIGGKASAPSSIRAVAAPSWRFGADTLEARSERPEP